MKVQCWAGANVFSQQLTQGHVLVEDLNYFRVVQKESKTTSGLSFATTDDHGNLPKPILAMSPCPVSPQSFTCPMDAERIPGSRHIFITLETKHKTLPEITDQADCGGNQ